MLNRIPREVWVSFVSIILTAFVSFYVPKLLEVNSIEMEYYERNKNEYISVPELLDGRVEILVDGKPQKNLASTDILLFNRSHKDLRNVPITFEFESPEPSKPIELLSKQLSKPKSFPKDSVVESKQKANEFVRYQISSFPKNTGYSTDFVASFIFLGDKAPEVKVQSDFSDGRVIDIYEYDQSRRDIRELVISILIVIPAIIIFIVFMVWQTRNDRAKLLKRIENETSEIVDGLLEKNETPSKEKIIEISKSSYLSAIGKTNKSRQKDAQKTRPSA